jgi:hypothetical protein
MLAINNKGGSLSQASTLYQLYANNNSLTAQNIDQILQFFAYSGITGGTCYLQDQTTGAGPS